MKISDFFKKNQPVISFEFFPPKTDDGLQNLLAAIADLKSLGPSYVSMTYGAGGSTRAKTVELVSKIKREIGVETMAHLTCVGHTAAELNGVLKQLESAGIENVLALRGDPPKGQTSFVPVKDGFAHAVDLVKFIRKNFSFSLGVAGYPEKHIEAPSVEHDLKNLVDKINAGADFVITQLFFDNADYDKLVAELRKRNIRVPIVPGIMPITDFDQIKRFAAMCGARIPASLHAALERVAADKEAVAQIGVEHAARQCEELLAKGAPGLHFYTLNKSRATRDVFATLKKKKVTV